MEEAARTAKQSAESVSKGGEKLGKTAAFKAISQVSESGPGRGRDPQSWWPSATTGLLSLTGCRVGEEGD